MYFLQEINPKYSWDGLMLKLQYFGHLMQRTDSLEKTLMLWKIEGRRRRGWQRMRWLDGITDSMHMSSSYFWHGSLVRCSSWGRRDSDTTEQINWTELNVRSHSTVVVITAYWCYYYDGDFKKKKGHGWVISRWWQSVLRSLHIHSC